MFGGSKKASTTPEVNQDDDSLGPTPPPPSRPPPSNTAAVEEEKADEDDDSVEVPFVAAPRNTYGAEAETETDDRPNRRKLYAGLAAGVMLVGFVLGVGFGTGSFTKDNRSVSGAEGGASGALVSPAPIAPIAALNTSAPVTSAPVAPLITSAPVTSAPVAPFVSSAPVTSAPGTSAPIASGTTSAPIASGTTSAPIASGTTSAPIASGTTSAPIASGTTSAPIASGTTSAPIASGTTSAPIASGTTSAPIASGTTSAPIASGTTSAPIASGTSAPVTAAPVASDAGTEAFVTYLSTLVSDPAALLDTTSAQSLAVSWLANEDPLQLDPTVLSPENQLRIRQRYALTTLYFSTKESWRQDSNWLNGDECLWFGVTCYPADSPDLGPQTVLALELENNLLTDTLPADLGLLTDMTILNLAGNAITGTIPTQIADLSALEQLDLRKNALSGEIPALGGLVNLSILNLNQQEVGLTGPIPTSLGLLVNLVECRLHGNQLRGTIPSEIANMSQLTLLNILSNALTGQVPSALGNLAALENFYLSENQITGAVPSDLCAIASLAEMEVDCTVSCDCCIDCVGEDGSI